MALDVGTQAFGMGHSVGFFARINAGLSVFSETKDFKTLDFNGSTIVLRGKFDDLRLFLNPPPPTLSSSIHWQGSLHENGK